MLHKLEYRGTIEEWNKIKMNGAFSDPCTFADKLLVEGRQKPYRLYEWNSGKTKMTEEEAETEENRKQTVSDIALLYERYLTENAELLEESHPSDRKNPIMNETLLRKVSEDLGQEPWLTERAVRLAILSGNFHSKELVDYRRLVSQKATGTVCCGWLQGRWYANHYLSVENGETTIFWSILIDSP